MNQAVTVQPASVPMAHQPMELSVAEVGKRKQAITRLMREVMIEGQHYGKVPGTDNKALHKPGAEVLGMMFQLAPRFVTQVNQLEGGHREYSIECQLIARDGTLVATGMGLCSTMESKYRWRWAGKTCPTCGAEAIGKGTKGWFCASKKGGCGKSFPDGDRNIERQKARRVENPDIADVMNTVLKMAAKRAHVHAILMATGASDMFVQEEEAPDDLREEPTATPAEPDGAALPSDEVRELAADCARLASQLGRERDEIAELLRRAGVVAPEASWTELSLAQLQKAKAVLEQELGKGRQAGHVVLALLAAVLICLSAAAQIVSLSNASSVPWSGWKRCTVDTLPPHECGEIGGALYVLGRQVGLQCWVIDVRLAMAPGQRWKHDLANSTPAVRPIPQLPVDPIAWFGGPVELDGRTMEWVGLEVDGAGVDAHLRRRVGRTFCVDLWLTWYPDSPAVSLGEVTVTSSNGTVADMGEATAGMRLTFGDAIVVLPGRGAQVPLVAAGTWFADGQARSFPIAFVWLRHLNSAASWSSVGAQLDLAIGGIGIGKLWPDGNPVVIGDARSWAAHHWSGALSRLHTWEAGPLGVAATSTQTGAQEDQIFVGVEAAAAPGAEVVRYLVALGQTRRPCHHLELDGSQVDPLVHTRWITWMGRAHWHSGVSPDQLGKPRPLGPEEVPGQWWGPDREHWLGNTLMAGARYTGSRALQQELRQQAILFLSGETTTPGWSTSSPDAARSVGYAGILVSHLWHNLEDRAMAQRVSDRWRERVLQVYVPVLGAKPGDVWDPRDDARILQDLSPDYTHGVMWWQQSLGSYGLDLACAQVGPSEGRDLALRAARAVVRHAWRKRPDGRWVFWDNVAFVGGNVLPDSAYVEGVGAHRTGWFDGSWAVPCLAVILRHDPDDEVAGEIWDQVASGGGPWVPPGVR